MRPRPISRLIRINRAHRRGFVHQKRPTARELDKQAEENFTLQATSQPARDLIHSPQRDVYSYDKKPSVRFATPALSSLHARIGLPSAFPLSTLQRCLTDPSVESDHAKHNEALSVLGSGLLNYYVSEYLCVRWPRLPMSTQMSALWAYTGESALARTAREWGLQSKSTWDPDKEREIRNPTDVDPRILVRPPSTPEEREQAAKNERMKSEIREQAKQGWVEDPDIKISEKEYEKRFVLLALQRFVQSLVGGVYVHTDTHSTQSFINAHILSRTLPPLSTFYSPSTLSSPSQEVTRLCERLKIDLPISRLIAESGRHTRSPIFVVGVYSGREKLGEGQGSSLREAKVRANTNALRAWYLYEQGGWELAVPSRTEDPEKSYVTGYMDPGAVVI